MNFISFNILNTYFEITFRLTHYMQCFGFNFSYFCTSWLSLNKLRFLICFQLICSGNYLLQVSYALPSCRDSPSAQFWDHLWQGIKRSANFSTLCVSLCLSVYLCSAKVCHIVACRGAFEFWFFKNDSFSNKRGWYLHPKQALKLQTKISPTPSFVQGVNSISPLVQDLWPLLLSPFPAHPNPQTVRKPDVEFAYSCGSQNPNSTQH